MPRLLASPATLTCTRHGCGAPRASIASSSAAESTECTSAVRPATYFTLLLCSGPMKCHSGGTGLGGQQGALVAQLLGVVLAERALAGGERGAHVVGGHLLADRQQANRLGRASGGARGGRDAFAHPREVAGDLLGAGHVPDRAPNAGGG